MSDGEGDFAATDAGAADCTPCTAGDLKKNDYVVIKGHACKISDISFSKTGKHGHAKANLTAYDIFTNKKYEDMQPGHQQMLHPIVVRTEYQLMDVNDGDQNEHGSIATLMSEAGETVEDLRVPDDDEYKALRDAIKADKQDIFVTVLAALGIRKVLPQFIAKDR